MNHRALVGRFMTDVVGGARPEAVHDLLAPGFVMVSAAMPEGEAIGPEGFARVVAGNRAAFPDWTPTIDGQVEEGDWIVTRWTSRATHCAPYQGVAATGRAITVRGSYWHRIEDGRIAEHRTYADILGLMRQLTEA